MADHRIQLFCELSLFHEEQENLLIIAKVRDRAVDPHSFFADPDPGLTSYTMKSFLELKKTKRLLKRKNHVPDPNLLTTNFIYFFSVFFFKLYPPGSGSAWLESKVFFVIIIKNPYQNILKIITYPVLSEQGLILFKKIFQSH